MIGEIELAGLQGACENYKKEAKRLKQALRRINDAIQITGPNSIGMTMTIFELKGIVETALEDDDDK